MDTTLRIKAAIIGTPIEPLAQAARRLMLLPRKLRHPELSEIFEEDTLLRAVVSRLMGSDSNGVDVGCHIGSFLSLLLRISPNGHHLALEPSPSKSAFLLKKFPSCSVIAAAVSDRAGRAVFEENLERPGYSKLAGAIAPNHKVRTYEVDIYRLDDLVHRKVDLVKIDVEGHELWALRGATRIISKYSPAIIFERGSEYEAEKAPRIDLFRFITGDLRYNIFTFKDFLTGRPPLDFGGFQQCGMYPFKAFNFLALPHSTGNQL